MGRGAGKQERALAPSVHRVRCSVWQRAVRRRDPHDQGAGTLLCSACSIIMQLLVRLAPFGCMRRGTLVPSPLFPLQQQTVADR